MKNLFLLVVLTSLMIACSSANDNSTSNRTNSLVAKTNTNEADKSPYLQTENAYTYARNSIFARDLTPSGKGAREIVGKTVSESDLWQNNVFASGLKKLMGADYATMKKFWNTETPIKKFGDYLMMTGCEQHNCAVNQYVIFIDLGTGGINVVHISNDSAKEWNGNRKIKLPPPFEEELAVLKSKNEFISQ